MSFVQQPLNKPAVPPVQGKWGRLRYGAIVGPFYERQRAFGIRGRSGWWRKTGNWKRTKLSQYDVVEILDAPGNE